MKKRLLSGLVALFLISGVLILAIMQLNWTTQSARVTMEGFRRSMMSDVSRGMGKLLDEIETVFSLLKIEPGDYRAQKWDTFQNNLDFLKDNTYFFDYMENMFLLPLEEPGKTLTYLDGGFIEAALPDYLADYRQELIEHSPWEFMQQREKESVFLVEIGSDTRERNSNTQAIAVLILHLDITRLYSHALSAYMEEFPDRFPFIIKDNNKKYYTSNEILTGKGYEKRKADFNFPLVFPVPKWSPREEKDDDTQKMEEDLLSRYQGLRFLIQKLFGRGNSRQENELQIKIYYPDGPLEEIISRQTFLSQFASVGFLMILLVSIIFLYRLYKRMKIMREKEQEFVATISHELRTPIAVIQSTSDNLSTGIINQPEKVKKYGQVIGGQVKRLSRMVENILIYSGLEGKGFTPGKQNCPINLGSFFDELAGGVEALCDEKGMKVHIDKESFIGRINGDPMALRLVLENLVVNSIRHGTGKEIRLFCKRKIRRGIIITIEDDGPGIPTRERKGIFNPFKRGNRSITEHIAGSGLGLHIVKRITGLLEGSVTLESPYSCIDGTKKEGCRFTLSLPLEVIDG